MLTPRFFILLGVCIVCAMLGLVWAPMVVVAKCLVWALVAVTVADLIAVLIASRRVRVKRTHAELLSLGQPNPVTVDIELLLPEALRGYFELVSYDTLPGALVGKIPHPAGQAGDGPAPSGSMGTLDRRAGDGPPPSGSMQGPHGRMVGTGQFAYNVFPGARGRHEFGVVRCFVRSCIGLGQAVRFVPCQTVVRIYPTFHQLDELEAMALSTRTQQGQKRVRWPGNSTEFEQIRPYTPGDDIRTINWRATARAASLMVNTYTSEHSLQIIPVVCAGPSMLIATDGVTLLDRAASAAVALASSAIRHYDEAGLITLSHLGVDTYVRPQRAPGTMPRILESLYDFGLPPTDSERELCEDPDVWPDDVDPATLVAISQRIETCRADADYDALADFVTANIRRRSLLVLFANFENLDVARQAIPALQRIARQHALVVVLFENEGAAEVAKAPYRGEASQALSEMRFRTICAHYIEQQLLLASQLRQNRVNVVLTPPDGLSAAVLSKYLELKNRAMI